MTGRAFLRPWQQGRGSVQALRVGHHQVRQGFAIGGVAVAVRLVGVEQDRVAGGEQEALLVDPHFQYPLRHHQVLLGAGGVGFGVFLAEAAQAQFVELHLARHIEGEQRAAGEGAVGADQALALLRRQHGDTGEGAIVEEGCHRHLETLGDLAQHLDRRHAAPGLDLRQHRPADTGNPRQGVQREIALAAQAQQVVGDALANQIIGFGMHAGGQFQVGNAIAGGQVHRSGPAAALVVPGWRLRHGVAGPPGVHRPHHFAQAACLAARAVAGEIDDVVGAVHEAFLGRRVRWQPDYPFAA
ncbi:Putative uncharacterized protein [Pseudomonas aeruginosa]|nr:Putative uncharacterized protein [Pseudomonas aeruginosa]